MSQTDQDRRIDYIELPTTDIGEMKRFYSGAFGWSFTDYGPDYSPAEVNLGAQVLIVGVDLGFEPVELGDFLAGLIFRDPVGDDL